MTLSRDQWERRCALAGYPPGVLPYEDWCGPDAFLCTSEIEPEVCDPKADKIRMDAREEEGRARAERIDRMMNPEWY